jgi:uncharacterized RDD family membrane protein YckC
MLDTAASIETPEHIELQLQIAGPGRRALAYAIDILVRSFLFFMVTWLLMLSALAFGSYGEMVEAHEGLMLIAYFAFEWFYGVVFEWLWDGRTIGKRAVGLRVVKEGGYPIALQDALLRNLLRAADLWPAFPVVPIPTYLVGVAVCVTDRKFRRLGDLVAGTLVIVDSRARRSAGAVITPPPQPEELAGIPAHPRLSAAERRTLDSFVRRLRAMHPNHAEDLCAAYAEQLARRLGVPPPPRASRFLQLIYARLHESVVPVRRGVA